MSAITRESVLSQALTLPPEDREAIAEALLLTVDNGGDEPIDPEWAAEIRRRLAAYDRAEVQTQDAFDMLRRLREKYAR